MAMHAWDSICIHSSKAIEHKCYKEQEFLKMCEREHTHVPEPNHVIPRLTLGCGDVQMDVTQSLAITLRRDNH